MKWIFKTPKALPYYNSYSFLCNGSEVRAILFNKTMRIIENK